uniref:Homeodomain-like superfamily protein n=1 Tax=Gongylonema pulchrum TaxID=637853 RepID=A0A183ELH4_9BILA
LCEKCEKDGAHSNHPLIRYANPRTPRLDIGQQRRHWYRPLNGYRNAFVHVGLFGHTVAHTAHHSAYTAAQHAAQHVGIEHLKEVGTQIQQALSNFGIDVDVGVQHGGITEKIPKLESPGNEITEPKREEVNLTEEKSCISPEATDAKSEDGKQKNDLDFNVVTLQEFDGLERSLEDLHITKKCSENQPDTDEATKEADVKSPACDSAAAVEDNISEDWTMLEDINNSGNKTNLGNGEQSLAVKDLF